MCLERYWNYDRICLHFYRHLDQAGNQCIIIQNCMLLDRIIVFGTGIIIWKSYNSIVRIIRIQLNLDKKCFLVTLVLRRMQYNFSIIVCNCLKQVYERVLIGGLMHVLNQGYFWYTCNFFTFRKLPFENLLKFYFTFSILI